MVKLVAVCRDDEDFPFESRQLPLNVDKSLTLVVQFDDQVRSGYRNSNAKMDFKTFIKNYNILSEEEVKQACMINARDLTTFLSHMVPCVGCRRSVEQMFHQVAEQGHPALDPLVVSFRSTMSIKRAVTSNPTLLYKLFYHDVHHTYERIENILNNKKNKRCFIHSLEMQKPRLGRALAMSPNNGQACTNLSSLPPSPPSNNTPVVTPYYGNGSWMDIWNDLSNECKEEVVILDCEGILDLMEDYLKRHRFCKDCKSKVARAFGILVDEIDPKKESTYCSALYVGLRFCGPKSKLALEREAEEEEQMRECEQEKKKDEKEDKGIKVDKGTQAKKLTHDKATETSGGIVSNQPRHIHVCCETNYIAHLMTRAEAEISGGRRERHAKTIDVAQEEVLTCISLYLYERLHRLWKKVRAESQTWRVLFYVCVETMRSVFEICIEEKVGMGKLEALCEEFEEAERSKEKKQEKKRQKKKRQKKRKEEQKKQETVEDQVITCNGNAVKAIPQPKDGVKEVYHQGNACHAHHTVPCHTHHKEDGEAAQGFCQACDLGYSSGYCESSVSSREGSEVNCSDGFCNHEDHECSTEHTASFQAKLKAASRARKSCRPCEFGGIPQIATVQSEGSCDGCQSSQGGEKKCKKGKKAKVLGHGGGDCVNGKDHGNGNFQSRLLEMLKEEPTNLFGSLGLKEGAGDGGEATAAVGSEVLEVEDDFGGDAGGLTAEEIAEFELNRSRIHEERIVLREKIRKNFEHFCGNRGDGEEAGLVVNGGGQEVVTVASGGGRQQTKGKTAMNGAAGKKKSKK